VPWLPGFRNSAPVRIGNGAHNQMQLDVFGEVMDALHQARRGGIGPAGDGWAVQIAFLKHLEAAWTESDESIWEVRSGRRHFTYSKVMAWVAFDRAIKSAEEYRLDGPLDRWRTLRMEIHADVCRKGFDPQQQSFVQSYDSKELDASLLLLPVVGFLPPQDPAGRLGDVCGPRVLCRLGRFDCRQAPRIQIGDAVSDPVQLELVLDEQVGQHRRVDGQLLGPDRAAPACQSQGPVPFRANDQNTGLRRELLPHLCRTQLQEISAMTYLALLVLALIPGMAAAAEPGGHLIASDLYPGQTADDPLYIPAIQAVQQALGVGGRTYVGDCKMAALATRGFVAAGGDFYLCPLSETQIGRGERRELLRPVWDGTQPLQSVCRPGIPGQPDERVAQGFSVDVPLTAWVEGKEVAWTEQRWLVRSEAYARTQEAALERRLATATAALGELTVRKQGKKQLFHAELGRAAEAIVTTAGVTGLLSYTVQALATTRQKRAYGDRPARQETDVSFVLTVQRDAALIEEKKREMGWQVYGTNHGGMGLPRAVWAYRGQYRIENDWSRLKGRPLGLTPLYLQDEGRIQGLVYLLSLALRVLTLLEWVVRERLEKEGSKLQEIYAGQPGRKTARPSAELLLRALESISVSVVEVNGQIHALLSPLTAVQQRLLELW
jgi:transposase